MELKKTITPQYETKGKRQKLTGYIGELCDETTCLHFKEYKTYHDAEAALDALAFELLTDLAERGLVDELPTFDPTTCVFCSKPHSPQSCPEMRAILFAPDAPIVYASCAHREACFTPCAVCVKYGVQMPLDVDFAPTGFEV